MPRPPSRALIRCLGFVFALLILTGCNAGGWKSVETPHIRLTTQVSDARAEEVATQLEETHVALSQVFFDCASKLGPRKAEVTLVWSEETYEYLTGDDDDLERARSISAREESGYLALPPRVVMLDDDKPDSYTTQRFTYVLANRLAVACFPDAPVWLTHGLAAVYSTLRVEKAEADDAAGSRVIVIGAPAFIVSGQEPFAALVRVRGTETVLMPRHLVPSATDLLSLSAEAFYDEGETTLGPEGWELHKAREAGAWALAHMLHLGPDAPLRERFRRYLTALRVGNEAPAYAFAAAFADVDLDQKLARYTKASSYGRIRAPLRQEKSVTPVARRLSRVETSLLKAELLYQFRGNESAPTIAAQLDEVDAPSTSGSVPVELAARATLLRAELDSGSTRAAHVASAVRLAPESLDALRAEGLEAVNARAVGDAAAAATRKLVKRKDLRFEDLTVVARLMLSAGRPATSLKYATRAIRIEPAAWEARYLAGHALRALGETAHARRQLVSAANLVSGRAPDLRREILRDVRELDAAPEPAPAPEAPPTPKP